MRKVKVHYPWLATARFEKFFIPTLRLEETKRDGLAAALHHNIKAKAEFGVFGGKMGVMFIRVR
jgi:hypothetical protein